MNTTRRALVAWTAVFALFIQALMPLSSAWALEDQQDDDFQVICTVNGLQIINVGQGDTPLDLVKGTFCPFCTMHSTTALFLPEVANVSYSPVQTEFIFAQAKHIVLSNVWRGAPRPSRAPPLFV